MAGKTKKRLEDINEVTVDERWEKKERISNSESRRDGNSRLGHAEVSGPIVNVGGKPTSGAPPLRKKMEVRKKRILREAAGAMVSVEMFAFTDSTSLFYRSKLPTLRQGTAQLWQPTEASAIF